MYLDENTCIYLKIFPIQLVPHYESTHFVTKCVLAAVFYAITLFCGAVLQGGFASHGIVCLLISNADLRSKNMFPFVAFV